MIDEQESSFTEKVSQLELVFNETMIEKEQTINEKFDSLTEKVSQQELVFNEKFDSLTNKGTAKSMQLSTHSSTFCGAHQIEVKLKQGSTTCQTGNHGSGSGFDPGETLTWDDFGNCDTEEFDLDDVYIDFYLIASSEDTYCPNRLSVGFKAVGSVGQVSYLSEDIGRRMDNSSNGDLFRATRQDAITSNW